MPNDLSHLVSEIQAGNCVAFVGAGFSAAAGLPRWSDLLLKALGSPPLDARIAGHIEALVKKGSAHDLDEAAQVLEGALGRPELVNRIRAQLAAPELNDPMARRLRYLKGIPFRAILTTNFDPVLKGELSSPEAYRRVLRPDTYRWWDRAFWGEDRGAFVMKLHGAIDDSRPEGEVVLTRRDYRRRLYEGQAYATFLRSVFASHTVLYLGFSFTDAYLNELRSEVLSLLGHGNDSPPVAYAVANDVPALTVEHFRRTEGVQFLTYDSRDGQDHSGFDDVLRTLWDETNPLPRFARLLEGRRLLWVDPSVDNNEAGVQFLTRAARASGRKRCEIEFVATPDEAMDRVAAASPDSPYHLAITRWGAEKRTAEHLLARLRERDVRCPVIVFASDFEAEERKPIALGLGAMAYCFRWESLFREIDRVFSSAQETG